MIARFCIFGLLACLAGLPVCAQESLESMVSQANAEWMFGKWETQSDNGETVTLNISWELKKNFVLLHVKAGDMEVKGYAFKDPASEEVKYVSFDDRGSVGKGAWGMEAEELVLRLENQTVGRGSQKMGFVFGGSPSQGLEVRMHAIDDSSSLVTPARTTLKFKKK